MNQTNPHSTSSQATASQPSATASGAHSPLSEQATAVNDHSEKVSVTRRIVDGLASDASSIAVAVEETLTDVVESPEEWVAAGRTVVRRNPLLAIGGAALIGLAAGIVATRAATR